MGTKKTRRSTRFEKIEILSPKAEVVSLDEARNSKKEPLVRQGRNTDGSPMMTLLFPSVPYKGKPWEEDVSFMLTAPNLAQPFAEALLHKAGGSPNVKTLTFWVEQLMPGFFPFLIETSQERIGLSDMTKALLDQFMDWLDAAKKDGKTRWSESTRMRLYTTPVQLLREIQKLGQWKHFVPRNFHAPKPRWSGAHRRKTPVAVINTDLITRIRLACIAEVQQIMRQCREAQAICEQYEGKLVPFANLPPMKTGAKRCGQGGWTRDLIIAYLMQIADGGPLMTKEQIAEKFSNGSALKSALTRRRINVARHVAPCFHATSRTMVPFVLLMAIALAYNPDTLRNSKVGDYSYSEELGRFFVGNAFKGRAGEGQPVFIPVDDEVDNPYVLFTFLLQYTERLRAHVDPAFKNNLFLFTRINDLSITSYNAAKDDSLWRDALELFRKDNGLEHFNLNMIRKTVLDMTYEIFNGDIKAVQIQAVHKSADTADIYSSSGEKQRRYERLGTIMQQRERHRETSGLIDQRNRSEDEDLNCATPGWSCTDSYDSPFSTKGKLCAKYGWCPICPLAKVKLDSPLSFAYLIGLRDAINRAQASMSPETWMNRLGPVKMKLEEVWLPLFEDAVIHEAKKLHIPLMPMPE